MSMIIMIMMIIIIMHKIGNSVFFECYTNEMICFIQLSKDLYFFPPPHPYFLLLHIQQQQQHWHQQQHQHLTIEMRLRVTIVFLWLLLLLLSSNAPPLFSFCSFIFLAKRKRKTIVKLRHLFKIIFPNQLFSTMIIFLSTDIGSIIVWIKRLIIFKWRKTNHIISYHKQVISWFDSFFFFLILRDS